MATKKTRTAAKDAAPATTPATGAHVSTDTESLLLAALERGGDVSKTGRYLVTFKEGAADAAVKQLKAKSGLRMAHAKDFTDQAVALEATGDADAVVFPDINVALIGGPVAQERALTTEVAIASDDPYHSIDPEYFIFANGINASDYMKGVLHTAQMIARDLGVRETIGEVISAGDVGAEVLGATWGLLACKVPASTKDGNGIKVAVLDTGFDLGHPEFAGRSFTTNTFVGQPVQDLHGHGTHTTGTATGPSAPAGPVQRYGIAFKSQIFSGKVLTNSGSGTQAQSLAGINWAVTNKCEVISMSLGAPVGVQPAYTAAGQAALNAGCLIIAAAGNSGPGPTEAPGNSPTIVAVAAVDINLQPAAFSCRGKIEIAGPGVNVFSSWPRPKLHNTISGTSMATPHVTGCAALWAQSSPGLRGVALRAKLVASAKPLPFPASIVGAGLVQAAP
jgi:subtilisin family serine protease